jgi:predicted nucleotidyltransferase
MQKINIFLEKLIKICNPTSIILYGSRAREDYLETSDFEIIVLIPESRYISRKEIENKIKAGNIRVYPFRLEDFKRGIIDTPFQKKIFLREIIVAGKTLYGEKIIENISPPEIFLINAIQELRFNIGYAFSSMHSYRNKDKFTALFEFYKSCLFGTRSFLLLKKRELFIPYNEIFLMSKEVDLGDYTDLVKTAYNCRIKKIEQSEVDIFRNMSYLNKFIEPQLISHFNKYGNEILIK